MFDRTHLEKIEQLEAGELRKMLRECVDELDRLREENARLQKVVAIAASDTERMRDA